MANLVADRARAKGDFVEISDGVVHYELSGARDGPLVVLVHGFSTPYYGWDGVMDRLHKAGFRVLRYDLFGRGWSDRPWTQYDSNFYDRQLVQLLAVLCIEGPVAIVGWSMGAVISSTYALRNPDRVTHLGLLAPAGLPVKLPLSARLVSAPIVGEILMLGLGHRVLIGTQHRLFSDKTRLPVFLDRFAEQLHYPGLRRALLSTLRQMPLETHSETYAELGRRDLPILAVWGKEDQICPFANHHRLQELLPQMQLHALKGTGHGLAIERPLTVAKHLCDFLTKPAR